ncbi:hypothetical protein SOPP22_08495 [Shewanella sp. OPT22]|nr:hypothetical protein SOPP22_08495 [Shewanella sp. OPT22]
MLRSFRLIIILVSILLSSCNDDIEGDLDLVLNNVRLIDVTSGHISEEKSVGIKGNQIVRIHHSSMQGKSTIDGSGLLLSPAFIDTHVHLTFIRNAFEIQSEEDFLAFYQSTLINFNSEIIESGVTSVVDAASFTPFFFEERERLKKSNIVSPKVYTVGKVVVNPQSRFSEIICQGSKWCEDNLLIQLDEQSNVVDELSALVDIGADGIKVIYDSSFNEPVGTYERISENLTARVIQYSQSVGLPIVSHTVANEEFASLSLLNIDAFIHSPFPENNSFDVEGANLSEILVHSKTPVATTAHHFDPQSVDENERDSFISFVENDIRPLMRRHLDLGVMYAFGTDFSDNTQMSYADTFQREVRALELLGFTNLEILQSLTVNAANFPMIKGNYGLVKVGYAADLLLFDKNPLESLIFLNKPKIVIQRGNVVYENSD